ncbi:4-hydroxy-tetrahydrodipicolinate synthase [Colwellia sp. 4_MG-2023]|uniref:4-hydroxy-tetrahydrodipicolinate synthase n=1 Tax=unclassified Colwellia TaxID=196834 RepID=UPI0026E1A01D|nr:MULTISPECIES: 4-hydroxy-tetrahydrodipicolinate synthase [unclassified Colwellia]MDO6506118.1 4-hydroxy-tetrahydrodipicolinate synthase [Colwellia sp. 5_MG-2023]MDO6554822.1 4-hydroxy-tetrahydrodipicolinate synthase [Colwellia sp. 4_MG-2023]
MNTQSPTNINSQLIGNRNLDACSLWTALVTPFLENNQIDFTSLERIAIAQAEAGNGILLLGSTGEGLALTRDEQMSIVEFVCSLQLNTPLMVAVGGSNLAEQINWVDYCNQLPIDSFLLGTPLYAKPGVVGQTQWFKALLDAANFPCMLYNVPSRSGVEIPVETLQNLQNHPNCWAMKEASGDLHKFLNYREQCPGVALYSGEDAMMPYLVPAGAKGLVSVCANAWPQATQTYVQLCLVGQTNTMFPLWNRAVAALFCVANPIPVKMLMQQQQNIKTPILRAPLTHLELTDNTELLAFDEKINQWLVQANQSSFINIHENRNIA